MIPFIEALRGLCADQVTMISADDHRAADQRAGQGLVEYALILSFIAILVIVALIFFGTQLTTLYSKLGNSIPAT